MAPSRVTAATRKLTGDDLEALQEQRDFLLRSLEDLEAEHEAGDVDDEDYEVLRDDYTSRAAGVIRAIERHEARVRGRRRSGSGWRVVVAVLGVVLFALGAGVLVAQTAGRRGASDQATGEISLSVTDRLARADQLLLAGDYEGAITGYDEVLARQPDHVQALTFKGWAHRLALEPLEALESLNAATEINPRYETAWAFLVVTYYTLSQESPDVEAVFRERAQDALATLDALDLDATARAEIDFLLGDIRAALED